MRHVTQKARDILILSCCFLCHTPISTSATTEAFILANNNKSIHRNRSFQRPTISKSDHQKLFSQKITSADIPASQDGPEDSVYNRDNITKQMECFTAINNAGKNDPNVANDVYARDPQSDVWWFVGKIARCTGTVTLPQAVSHLHTMVKEHSCRLRPVELGRCYDSLELWTAPIDSELELANNVAGADLNPVIITKEGMDKVRDFEVGFYCEYVMNNGEGFSVRRNLDGTCL